MQVILSPKKDTQNHTNLVFEKAKTLQVSTTFAGCYLFENIGKKQFCFVFDRGMEY
jgi:hypothetical protein